MQHLDLGFFLVDEILAGARAVLSNGVAALLDHAFDDALYAGVVQRPPRVDFALFDAGQRHAQDAQARLISAAHSSLHFFLKTVFERHDQEAMASRVDGALS